MIKTRNTLSESIRESSVKLLNTHLAATIDLYAQIKQAHWNVRGPGFIAVHELFDTVAEAVEDNSDLIAERAGQLGGTAQGTIQVAVKQSALKAFSVGIADEETHIRAVASALAAYGELVHDAIEASTEAEDATTADLFTEISRGIDKNLWFVESHLRPTMTSPTSSTNRKTP